MCLYQKYRGIYGLIYCRIILLLFLDGRYPGQLRGELDEWIILHPSLRLQRRLSRLLVCLPHQFQLLRARYG